MSFIATAYKKVGPFFDHEHYIHHPQHYVYLCNASISGDAHLEWRTGNKTINNSSERDLSPAGLDRFCQDRTANEPISILLNSSNLTDTDGSMYLRDELALVICNGRQSRAAARYTCYSSDSSAEGPIFLVPAAVEDNQIVAITVPIAFFIVLLLIVLVLLLLFVYPYYCRLKVEPRRMFPIEPLSPGPVSPRGANSEENSHFEFPRENLVFVKVLGKLAFVHF